MYKAHKSMQSLATNFALFILQIKNIQEQLRQTNMQIWKIDCTKKRNGGYFLSLYSHCKKTP